jgi:hypothetical protein
MTLFSTLTRTTLQDIAGVPVDPTREHKGKPTHARVQLYCLIIIGVCSVLSLVLQVLQ